MLANKAWRKEAGQKDALVYVLILPGRCISAMGIHYKGYIYLSLLCFGTVYHPLYLFNGTKNRKRWPRAKAAFIALAIVALLLLLCFIQFGAGR